MKLITCRGKKKGATKNVLNVTYTVLAHSRTFDFLTYQEIQNQVPSVMQKYKQAFSF